MTAGARRAQAGFSLAALVATAFVMLLMLSAAIPLWRYVVKSEREQELISRIKQIQRAIERYQAKNGNAFPTSLKMLVEGKYLRKLYTDPMTPDGEWKLHPPGLGGRSATAIPPGSLPLPSPSPSRTRSRSGSGTREGQTITAFWAVGTTSNEKGLRIVNGFSRYDQWVAPPGQQVVVGKQLPPPGVRPGALPSPGATPLRLPGAASPRPAPKTQGTPQQ